MASKKKTKKCVESVVVTMVVDESGSMASLCAPTMAGFNEYVETIQKKMKAIPTYFSAITFDTRGIRKLQVGAALKDAIKLSAANYNPTGGTPLLDAVGSAISATDEVMDKEKAHKAIVVIQTDGEENSSREHTLASIKTMIKERQYKNWEFVFIGAGINAFADATKMGISGANTMSYAADAGSTRAVFGATASNSAGYGSGESASMNYTSMQSRLSGENKKITMLKMQHGKVKR